MRTPLRLILVVSYIFFVPTVQSQTKSKIKLKTNAEDTITLREMVSTDNGLGDGIRVSKILGRKYIYNENTVDVQPVFMNDRDYLNRVVYNKFEGLVYDKVKVLYPTNQDLVGIEFVINYKGQPTDIKITRSKYSSIDRKLIKFIESLPAWTPAIKDNKYVRARLEFSPNTIHDIAATDVQPEFPGGPDKFIEFVKSNMIYPPLATESHLEGKVYLEFVINVDGSVTDIKVIRKLGLGTDEEAVRLLKLTNKWLPGSVNGKRVRTKNNIFINFSLDS